MELFQIQTKLMIGNPTGARCNLNCTCCYDLSKEQLRSPGLQAASARIRLMLILKQIAKQEGISVEAMDLQRRIAAKAVEFGTTPKSLQEELEQEEGMERLRDMLLAESTLDYLIEKNGAGQPKQED